MKILVLAPMVPQREGGAIPILLDALLEGVGERHDVTFVSAIGDEPGELEAAAKLARDGVDAQLADRRQPRGSLARWRRRARLARAWLGSSRPWRTVWFADPGVQAILDRLAAARSFDLVVVEDSSMAMYRLPSGVPAVLTEHEVRRPRPVAWRRRGHALPIHLLAELDWKRWGRFQRQAWRRFDRIQVFTERDAAMVADIAPEVAPRVRVNPFGIVLPAQVDHAHELPGLILFVGNFTHPPNQDAAGWLATEILPAVRRVRPEARLRLVGAEPTREVLALAGPHVEVVADAPETRSHVEQAEVIVAPVRTGNGMRLKVLSALASGKALVTTVRGAQGYLVPGFPPPFAVADNTATLAAAIAALLGDGWRRRLVAQHAREFALERHSHIAWADRLEAIYAEACVSPSRVAWREAAGA